MRMAWNFLLSWWWVYWGLFNRALGNRRRSRYAYTRSVACFSRALGHMPDDAQVYLWRGTLYWRELDRPAQAEADLDRALELNPRLAEAYLNRAFVRQYRLPPDRAGAVRDLRAYLEYGRDTYWRQVAQQQLQQLGQ
ncbi:MAG: hypothetical protein JXA37_06295 [Chloroflexia bacterium]|nr:hypothetical protein [Chloroflexia bacterium]